MNDEEVVVSSQPEEQQVEQTPRRRQTIGETMDNVQQGMNDVGKTIETIGKGEERLGTMLGGGEKATKAAANVSNTTSSIANAGAASLKAAGKAQETAGKVQEAAGKATETVGKATEATGKGVKATGKGMEAAGQAVSAAGSSPYTAALKPIGEGIKAGGKGTQAGGAGLEAAGKTEQATGKAQQVAGKAQQTAGKAQQKAAEATQTAAKANKAATNAAKKATDKSFADKLRERGKLNQARGKRIQDLSKKFDSNELFDKLSEKMGGIGKVLKGIAKIFDPTVFGVLVLLCLIIGTIAVSYILSPMFFMNQVLTPDNAEKVNNFIAGLGFQDSEEAFYDEVNYLNTHYGEEIDFPYIMSTLYYTDIFYGDLGAYKSDNSSVCVGLDKDDPKITNFCDGVKVGVNLAGLWLKDARTTTGSDGLVYSANKLYRLRDLAKHQFLGGKDTKEKTLTEYIKMCVERVNNELKNVEEVIPLLIVYCVAYATGFGPAFETIVNETEAFQNMLDIFEGTENWASLQLAKENGKGGRREIALALNNLLVTYFNCFFEIKSIDFDMDKLAATIFKIFVSDDSEPDTNDIIDYGKELLDSITVTYYDYKYDEEKFEEYLINDYIRKMPEFSKLLMGANGERLTGDDLDNKVKIIAAEIKTVKDMFDGIYKKDESAQEYGSCIGDIDLDLLSELTPPVDLTIGQTVTFSADDNYGFTKGTLHRGVDLNADSVGVTEGSNVYSLYDGKVAGSTVDGTYVDHDSEGGGLAIDYMVQYANSSLGKGVISQLFKSRIARIRVYYSGLNIKDLTLKQGDIVTKGQVIGHIGSAELSEDGLKPSLHFGIFDLKAGTFLNPVNMFITCRAAATADCKLDGGKGTTLSLPNSIFEMPQINYTVTFYDKRGFGSLGIDGSSPQKKVHKLWLEDGARYKNGIAVVKVNGADRYLAAITKNFGTIGDLVYANLEDGTSLPLIVADEKSYKNTNNKGPVDNPELCMSSKATDPACYGHLSGKSLSVIEFEFDNDYLYKGLTSATQVKQDWNTNQKVISISNCGSATQ